MRRVKPGDTVKVRLPWSEVCLYMHVAEQVRDVTILENGAQILNEDGTKFSFPVTHGEAGIFSDAQGFYVQDDQMGDAM